MKVYILFPWKFVDSPYYRNLLLYPPKNVYYLNRIKKGLIVSPKKFHVYQQIKYVGRRVLQKLRVNIPIIKLRRMEGVDLVHSARCLLMINTPYVMDVEVYNNLFLDYSNKIKKYANFIVKKVLRRDNLKKILLWTKAAYTTFPSEIVKEKVINDKITVVYPAVPDPNLRNKRRKGNLTLLFIGRYFYGKGGHYVLEIFRRLRESYDIETIFISMTIPESLKRKYERYGIKIYRSVTFQDLHNKIYPNSDLFIYPGFSDTFGFAIIEALSYKIPVVTYNGFAREELVEDGKNGFLIRYNKDIRKIIFSLDNKLVDLFISKIREIIESEKILTIMSREAYRIYKSKFSIENRNKKLKEIYEEAVS